MWEEVGVVGWGFSKKGVWGGDCGQWAAWWGWGNVCEGVGSPVPVRWQGARPVLPRGQKWLGAGSAQGCCPRR